MIRKLFDDTAARNTAILAVLLTAIWILANIWLWPAALTLTETQQLRYAYTGQAVTGQLLQNYTPRSFQEELAAGAITSPRTVYFKTDSKELWAAVVQGQTVVAGQKAVAQTEEPIGFSGFHLFYDKTSFALLSENTVQVTGQANVLNALMVDGILLVVWIVCASACWQEFWEPVLGRPEIVWR